jgi:PAS domain S-box-containing protein
MTRIMVVDDEAVITTQLEERLTMMGYEVIGSATSGEEAVEKARQLKPDIILMDIVMPGELNGIAASNVIKKELDIPVIFLTAYADDTLVGKAKNVEPLGYLIKPFQERQIRAAIEIAVYKREIELKLKESEERYRSVVNTASDAIITMDSHGAIQSWNLSAETIFGYTAEEVIGKDFIFILDKATGKDLKHKLNLMVSTGISTLVGTRMEYTGIRKDHSNFTMEFSLTSWDTKRGLFFTVIARDINERMEIDQNLKLALNERDVLYDEINDRVINILQVVSNLILLQSDYMQDAKSMARLGDCLNRIKTIELLYDKLNRTDEIKKFNFFNYVHTLVHHLNKEYKDKSLDVELKINNSVPVLDIDKSLACSLIINELVTNSLKHAFPGKTKGEIRIDMAFEKFIYMLTISDDGIGLTPDFDLENVKTFGLRLVKTMVKQLGGMIEYSKSPGTTFKIAFKSS